MSDINPGDWVTLTARVQVQSIEYVDSYYPNAPTKNAATSITYASGVSESPAGLGTWSKPKPALYTIEFPDSPNDGMEFTIAKENA